MDTAAHEFCMAELGRGTAWLGSRLRRWARCGARGDQGRLKQAGEILGTGRRKVSSGDLGGGTVAGSADRADCATTRRDPGFWGPASRRRKGRIWLTSGPRGVGVVHIVGTGERG